MKKYYPKSYISFGTWLAFAIVSVKLSKFFVQTPIFPKVFGLLCRKNDIKEEFSYGRKKVYIIGFLKSATL